ncbi:MAG: site-specific DNA-methyltransferase [Ruminococcaceae bacterium]|nr:site-specific DNA-methyltransferase [Oscillospiraceae bacterium]
MAELHELIEKIENPELRAQIAEAAKRALKHKQFGLVFEEHLPECTPLYDIPVRKGVKVSVRDGKANETYTVLKIEDEIATCLAKNSKDAVQFAVDELVTTAELGDPIYPYLQHLDEVCNAPDSKLWHTLIEADNYHALQLLEYLYAGKVDCIYIDPPYNTGARDWKYNNDYVDGADEYRHSKWLSFMQKRLEIAKRLLNPTDSVLIVTIDEKEYLHLGCLLEEMFSEAHIQMVSINIHPGGVARENEFARSDEYAFFVFIGDSGPACLELSDDWMYGIETTSRDGVHWRGLLRSGSNDSRQHSPNCFYPIFVSEDGKKFLGAGEPLALGVDRQTVIAPLGQKAIFPIHADGTEGCWQYSRDNMLSIQKKGYVRLGGFTPRGMSINYLADGEQKKVEAGLFKIIGKNEDGSLILDDSEYTARFIPTTQWCIKSHDSLRNGSNFIRKFFPDKRFDYPKSIYAVYDTIKFIVANKPTALIVDFFAGSGTTLNAVNLINAEDNGARRCIMVTNNEISGKESDSLKAKGIQPGEAEWEKHGIARYVTWPRTVCSIKGCDVYGSPLSGNYGIEKTTYLASEKPGHKGLYKKAKKQIYPSLSSIKMADGFNTNAVFFKLGFLDKTKVSLGMQFKELISTLWMKAGSIGKCPVIDATIPDMLILPENKMAILNDENQFRKFAEQLAKYPEIEIVYLVTDYESSFVAMTQALEGKTTYQLYRDYLDNFRINAGRNGR